MVFIFASPVRAQAVMWVANNGNDANACIPTSPCLTFQGAINKGSVAQINCLTSGNYGAVTITASITIDCGTGNIGEIVITPFDTAGIGISSGAPVTIVLRHLSINGGGTTVVGMAGIDATGFASGTLIVEDCMIQGFHGGYGINFVPNTGRGLLHVANSLIFDNIFGVVVAPQAGQIATVSFNGLESRANSSIGVALGGNGTVAGTMRDSVVGGNGQQGVSAFSSQVFFTVEESSLVANLSAGLITNSPGSVVNVGNSTIGANSIGVDAVHGSIISFGNNQMSANGSNGNFTSTAGLR
jgi:hypothetical protein